ncbi:cis-Golgi t-SNARE syntaxin [Saccharomyces cerevisiae]|uniref:K7_Sed5p n=1 Tax=Saccharomyces cerevisiae (strain Kyokai no. 7 / NBRC 101557) TaxID=721032 RepID=G2WIM0_YEASK|nr:Sed5p [Saccharomyces cerevisiae YJM1307]AJV59144.1 Sed5p [Saccharomyces cerevisiae YJM1388]AJV59584.1 Sed5p [Saccharomyces cerevisiae YJM1389]AJV63180.1 Sed5p [Saccharomyces cerevisiae YJM1419]AJV63633.1 Sed5p [Saccharomyces cerevisiae YJM1433]AJV66696.1 Sed5p [Saccharomyces cerevisiae YJM1460]AJV76889.1 Sed5p [Saccharomyces cerevisiae YJM451]CAI4614042.1 CLN_G0035500.mRNA.1.CDS.1 [Saccharomyces cerevisiae]GAA24913.1 K7_Sed5p [Saccharomyces cerevisiae Kyokai no. 7]
MNIKDRTSEFQQSVLSYKKRNKNFREQQRERLQEKESENFANNTTGNGKSVSEFQKKASGIAHEISSTAQLLSKLAVLAKRKPMFNDNPVEIAELSFLIKRKIYAIEQSLVQLSQLKKTDVNGNTSSQSSKQPSAVQHSKNVVNLLNTQMKNISGSFKDVLEERQRLEMANKDRWQKLTTDTGHTPADDQTQSSHAADLTTYNNSNPFMTSLLDESSEKNNNSSNQGELSFPQNDSQLMLMEEGQLSNNVYLQERNRAVETIESTIQEVGNLFQQLASMVQEQGEVIQRIDANVDDIDLNISGAQRELLKYFDRIKSNRWLAAKVFFIIFVFFVIWVLVN